ncbi:glycoside hydrolase family 127 protein [Solirubrobacter phytolaccae]|uniref:Glycoside hydrolase family 127 protein n=1 Tax=Solirubrobacter phytolaccae TaxID=1404360 RepID=A0A9X3N709_9ACTN|nr:beta-L-arabinofuranosidase domain-containing protein [Solirubrobacter phytolaccae]MDA0179467.1 glycoside hydrolase family 127 protein [Solirubrobacter phytolaccae]
MDSSMRRREFMAASAAFAAGAMLKPGATLAAIPGAGSAGPLPDYVGAGATAPIRPFPLYDVTLGPGLLKEKQDRMLTFLRAYDERRFLVLFNRLAGRPNPAGVQVPGGWEEGGLLSGHWTGHYLSALAQAASAGDAVLGDKLRWVVTELGAVQDALVENGLVVHPGYLGAKPEDTVLRLGPPRFAIYGQNQDLNTWAPWYTQHKLMRGFLDAYTLTGDLRALEIVCRMADWAHLALTVGDVMHPDYAGPPTREDLNFMWDTYIAGEYGGINEVLVELGELTGNRTYGRMAPLFDSRESLFQACVENRDILVFEAGKQPGRRRQQRLHANTHVPNFVGYMRIFERTGFADYHTASKHFFGMVVPHRMYAHGGTSGNFAGANNNIECFQNRDNIANSIAENGAETCTTYNLIKLARNLFFHDPDPAYIDYVERGLFNMIAGSRSDTNSNSNPQVTYFQPLTPGNRKGYGNTGTCCGGTGMENHTKHQESAYFRSDDDATLWVNLFIPSTLSWTQRGVTVTQETDFPRTQATKLTFGGAAASYTVKLRVPAWATKGYEVRVNGAVQALDAAPGSYVALTRRWAAGDTIEIAFPFSIRIERALDRPDTQSVHYGPLLMPILGTVAAGAFQQLSLYRHLKLDGDYERAAITRSTGMNFVAGGLTLRPHYVGDTQAHSPYFRRAEPEIVFGAVRTGVPNVKRDDDLPSYDVPVTGVVSPGDEGLTFLDVVWDQAPFASHAAFVAAVDAAAATLLTAEQRATVVTAAQSAEAELRV